MYNEYFSNREESAMGNNHFNASNDNYYQGDGNYYGADAGCGANTGAPEPSQPYILSIANSTTSAVTAAVMFDANIATLPTTTNFGNGAAITITMQNGALTYGQFLNQIKAKPFRVAQIMLVSTTAAQVLNAITFLTFDTFGASTTFSKTPFLNPFQNQSGSTYVDYPFTVDGNTKLTINIAASATLTAYFFPNKVYDFSRGLVGRNPSMPQGSPNAIGLKVIQPQMGGVANPMVQIGSGLI